MHKVCTRGPLVLAMCIAAACYPREQPFTAALVQMPGRASKILGNPLFHLYVTKPPPS